MDVLFWLLPQGCLGLEVILSEVSLAVRLLLEGFLAEDSNLSSSAIRHYSFSF